MSNVLITYDEVEPTNIEVTKFFNKLSVYSKNICVKSTLNVTLTKEDFKWTDIFIMVRPQKPVNLYLSKFMKKLHIEVVLLIDDDFFNLPDLGVYNYWADVSKRLIKIMRYTDIIISGNKTLALKCCKLGGVNRSASIGTIMDESDMNDTSYHLDSDDLFKMAYYVNDGSKGLFEKILRPILRKLAERYPDKIEISLFVVHPELEEFDKKIKVNYIDRLKYDEFKKRLAEGEYSIGLAPLDNGEFSRNKYFNKYVEYTMAGIPAVYSKSDIFLQVIKDGYNGILCENTTESWVSAIERLMNSNQLRKNIVDNAQKYAKQHFSPKALFDKLLSDMPELNRVHITDKILYSKISYDKIYGKYKKILKKTIIIKILVYIKLLYQCMRKKRMDIFKESICFTLKKYFGKN